MTGSPTKTICFFNSNRAWGGGEKWHYSTAKDLQRWGYKVYLVTNESSELRKKATEARLQVYPFRISNLSFLNPIKLLILTLFFKSKKIDTIILNLPSDLKSAGLAAKLAGVKKIIYRRGMPHPLRNTGLNRFLFRHVLTDVIVNSEEIGRSLTQGNESWFPQQKMKLLYNGIDTHLPMPQASKLYQKKADEFVIGNAGRLTQQKGQKYLLEMAEKLKQKNVSFQLLIAGEGELRSELQKQINEKNLSQEVTLLGHVHDMPAFMNSIDLFVFPSLFEGAANTLIETLHIGKPIVAFDVSSNPEIIQHGINGYLAKAFNTDEMTNYVLELLNAPQKRVEFVQNGKRIVMEKFENQKIREQLLKII